MVDKKVYLRRGQIIEKPLGKESAVQDSSGCQVVILASEGCIVETPSDEMPTSEKPLGARLQF